MIIIIIIISIIIITIIMMIREKDFAHLCRGLGRPGARSDTASRAHPGVL